MPELPDVEVFRKDFMKKALKKLIRDVHIYHPRILKNLNAKTLKRGVIGSQFVDTKRHGKYLFAHLSNGFYLVFHFGMTGFFHFFKKENPFESHTRLTIDFNENHLAFVDMRILGGITLVKSIGKFIQEKELGPDALSMTWNQFIILLNHRGRIKPTLMDQSNVAGVGNIYADEILFHAKVHPLRHNRSLTEKERKALFRSIKYILKKAIAAKVDVHNMPDSWFLPHRQLNEKCPRCKHPIVRIKLQGRGTYFCPNCQSI